MDPSIQVQGMRFTVFDERDQVHPVSELKRCLATCLRSEQELAEEQLEEVSPAMSLARASMQVWRSETLAASAGERPLVTVDVGSPEEHGTRDARFTFGSAEAGRVKFAEEAERSGRPTPLPRGTATEAAAVPSLARAGRVRLGVSLRATGRLELAVACQEKVGEEPRKRAWLRALLTQRGDQPLSIFCSSLPIGLCVAATPLFNFAAAFLKESRCRTQRPLPTQAPTAAPPVAEVAPVAQLQVELGTVSLRLFAGPTGSVSPTETGSAAFLVACLTEASLRVAGASLEGEAILSLSLFEQRPTEAVRGRRPEDLPGGRPRGALQREAAAASDGGRRPYAFWLYRVWHFMAETAANKELAERLPRLTGDDLKEKYPFWEDALSGWSCVSGWAEMEGFLSRPLNQACQHVESMSKPRKTAKEHVALTDLPERLLSWLYGSVGGSATRDFPCRSGGEAMETRYHLLRALVKLQDSNPDVFQELGEGIHALDHLESCSAESLAKVGSAMRDLVWQQLREDVEEEKRKGNPRVVTVQMIQPVREGGPQLSCKELSCFLLGRHRIDATGCLLSLGADLEVSAEAMALQLITGRFFPDLRSSWPLEPEAEASGPSTSEDSGEKDSKGSTRLRIGATGPDFMKAAPVIKAFLHRL
eukprot:g33427.t1